MPASLLTELVFRALFEVVFYGIGYVVGVLVVPIFSLGQYTVEPWDFKPRKNSARRSHRLAPRQVSADVAAGIGLATLALAGLIAFFLWRAAGA